MKIPNKVIINFEYNDENREAIFDIKELYDIIKEKQLIIDKAIEYIRNNSYKFLYYEENDRGQIDLSKCKYRISPLRATKVKQLLDILKGSDSNE